MSETADASAPETDPGEDATNGDDGRVGGPAELHGCPVTASRGQTVLHVPRDRLVEVAEALRQDGFLMCLDVIGVDYLTHAGRRDLPAAVAPERFEVVVPLLSHADRRRVRLRVQVPAEDPVIPSLHSVYPATEVCERETFDLYGIGFDGHPDLNRILMPEDWVGHPLRKDYEVGKIPVQFKHTEHMS